MKKMLMIVALGGSMIAQAMSLPSLPGLPAVPALPALPLPLPQELNILKQIQQLVTGAALGVLNIQDFQQKIAALLEQLQQVAGSVANRSVDCDSVNYDQDKCGCHHNKPRAEEVEKAEEVKDEQSDKCGCHHKPKSE